MSHGRSQHSFSGRQLAVELAWTASVGAWAESSTSGVQEARGWGTTHWVDAAGKSLHLSEPVPSPLSGDGPVT